MEGLQEGDLWLMTMSCARAFFAGETLAEPRLTQSEAKI